MPALRRPEPSEPSGRGLRIVNELADRFGVAALTGAPGKTVWFVVVLDDASIKSPARATQAARTGTLSESPPTPSEPEHQRIHEPNDTTRSPDAMLATPRPADSTRRSATAQAFFGASQPGRRCRRARQARRATREVCALRVSTGRPSGPTTSIRTDPARRRTWRAGSVSGTARVVPADAASGNEMIVPTGPACGPSAEPATSFTSSRISPRIDVSASSGSPIRIASPSAPVSRTL
jgi:hypothetical protein